MGDPFAQSIAGRTKTLALLLAVALIGVLGTVVLTSANPPSATAETATVQTATTATVQTAADSQPRAAAKRPNIVFILTDDLSTNMVKYLSEVRAMKRRGTTFRNYFVSDSLCCPSRANILTGRYPHNTKVLVNEGDRKISGGARAFNKFGNHRRTYAVALDKIYRTGFMGKYLNGYNVKQPVPPGWDEWHLSGNGYTNMPGTYKISRVRKKDGPKGITWPKKHYLTDLLGVRARKFAKRAHDRNQPFFLTLSTFAPHQRIDGGRPVFPAPRRDRPGYAGGQFKHGDCGTKPNGKRYHCVKDLKLKRHDGFTDAQYKRLNKQFRDRVRMVQSLNDQIKKLRKRLRAMGELNNTYFVFASDNGFHLGDHGFFRGKGTPYDHDMRVPLIIEGPGVKKGQVRHEITQTVDLYPTFQQMARKDPKPSNGHGLMALARGKNLPHWRHAALFEHKPQVKNGKRSDDPDLDSGIVSAGVKFNPAYRAYKAIRTKNWLYVRYTTERNALFDLRKNPAQTKNVIGAHPGKANFLRGWLADYAKCGSHKPKAKTCWKAGHAWTGRS